MIDLRLATELMARQDAVFAPFREFRDPPGGLDPARSTFGTLRMEFPSSGVPVPVADGSYQAQKEQREAIGLLVEAGIIEVFRPHGAKALGYRLTDAGEEQCRLGCGQVSLHQTLRIVDHLVSEFGIGVAFSEHDAIERIGYATDVESVRTRKILLQEDLSPALSRGWVESACQLSGHCFYTITEVGHTAAVAGIDLPAFESSNTHQPAYVAAFKAAFEAFRNMEPPISSDIGLLNYPG